MEDGRRAAIFAHGRDMDGLASAAIMARALEAEGREVAVDFIDYSTQEKDIERMKALEGTDIYVLDFAFDDPKRFEELDEVLARDNRIAYWNDHHPRTAEQREAMERYADIVDLYADGGRCAAEIARDRYAPQDPVTRRLADLAHDQDFWVRRDATANKLSDIISSGYDRQELVGMLKSGTTWSPELEERWRRYDARRQEAYARMDSRAESFSYGGVSCVMSLADGGLSSSDAGNHLLETFRTDLAVTMFRSGAVSFRRDDGCEVDLTEVARLFGGGGHAYASGAKLPYEIKDDAAYERALGDVDGRLAGYLGGA